MPGLDGRHDHVQGRARLLVLEPRAAALARQIGCALLNIGKAYSGLSDAEIESTTKLFKRLTEQVYGGRVRAVRPEVVLEVAFDGIQRSARHKSGFALRFPRIVRLRPDKPVGEIDTLERVAELYQQLLGISSAEQHVPPRDAAR